MSPDRLRRLCLLSLAVSVLICVAWRPASQAAPGDCTVNGSTGEVSCTGDHSQGIDVDADQTGPTLRVDGLLRPIQPAAGADAIRFFSGQGSDLSLFSGSSEQLVGIETTGAGARGIFSESVGTPPRPQDDDLLGVPIPGSTNVSGGCIEVESFSHITTRGRKAHGIAGRSRTSGYPESMLTDLESFDDTGISFSITSVADPKTSQGQSLNATSGPLTVKGRVVRLVEVQDDQEQRRDKEYEGLAGNFTIRQDGSFSFEPGNDFDTLPIGQNRTVSVQLELDGYRDTIRRRQGELGELSARVSKREDGGLDIVTRAHFDTFGASNKTESEGKAWPDLDRYVKRLKEDAEGAGGAGNSVEVRHLGGAIITSGPASHGIFAESRGQKGGNGKNGGGFWSFGTKKPTGGGSGNPGGGVAIYLESDISTGFQPQLGQQDDASVGVLAQSTGGSGGRGGNGGTYYYGRRGGIGGNGGLVEVTGQGTIRTQGHYGSGILALSEGGDGGDGGDGADVTGGGAGGYGGQGAPVQVNGIWDITTQGGEAHGVWAKSVGGNAGTGGSGGWLAGGPGGGGQATDGGPIGLISGGRIATHGQDAFALFGQSVGGFGGSGGSGGSIFYSSGGNGNSAGSGGVVEVTNLVSGRLQTEGNGSHALVAMSVGGGGGAGGGGAGLIGFGGSGAGGGYGGNVIAENYGVIQTSGHFARGMHVQSIGGSGATIITHILESMV